MEGEKGKEKMNKKSCFKGLELEPTEQYWSHTLLAILAILTGNCNL